MNQLYGALTAFEMRDFELENPKKEASFKASKKEMYDASNSDSEIDEEEAKFVRKLKRDTGKYKGNLPLKCLNCEEVGHFSS